MTNQRWQVLHVATYLGHRWVAQPEEDGPGTTFDTWREAMGHADRMSRTIEVELPRNPHRRIDVEIRREMEHIPTGFPPPASSQSMLNMK